MAARQAQNIELGVYALCRMSYVACWQGKTHIGIDLCAEFDKQER